MYLIVRKLQNYTVKRFLEFLEKILKINFIQKTYLSRYLVLILKFFKSLTLILNLY